MLSLGIFAAVVLWSSSILIMLRWRHENARTKIYTSTGVTDADRANYRQEKAARIRARNHFSGTHRGESPPRSKSRDFSLTPVVSASGQLAKRPVMKPKSRLFVG